MKNIIETLFTAGEILKLQELYDSAINNFNYEVELNPFAYPNYSGITDFINEKFEGLTDKLAKEITNELIHHFI